MKKREIITILIYSLFICSIQEACNYKAKETDDSEQLIIYFKTYCNELIEQRKIYHTQISLITLPDAKDLSYVNDLVKINVNKQLIKSQKDIDSSNYESVLKIQSKWRDAFKEYYSKSQSENSKKFYDAFQNFDLQNNLDALKLRTLENDYLDKFNEYFHFFEINQKGISVKNNQLSANNQDITNKYVIISNEFVNAQNTFFQFLEEYKLKRINYIQEINSKLNFKELNEYINLLK